MKIALLLAFILFTIAEIIPQKIDYFPISIGNEYQLVDEYSNHLFFKIEKDTVINGKTYYNYPHEFKYCRTDSLGNLYSISKPFFRGEPTTKPDEYLLFKADAQVNEIWKVAWDYNIVIDTGYAQCVYADTGYIFGKYRKIKGVRIFDASYDYYIFFLAEDLGLVEDRYDILYTGGVLNYAKINSVIYGTPVGVNDKIPQLQKFTLSQNYPNPFNPSTSISYSLPTSSNVKLIVFNTLGQKLKTLVSEYKPAGNYTVNFNASALPSGIYFYKLEAGPFTQIKKMILIK
jgi:hypothetical protein